MKNTYDAPLLEYGNYYQKFFLYEEKLLESLNNSIYLLRESFYETP